MPAPPNDSGVPPLVLVSGPEPLLVERAVGATLAALRDTDPQVEVTRVYPADYQPGQLAAAAAPSLFGGARALVVHQLDEASEALQTDLLRLLADPGPDLTLIVLHSGGARARKVLDALKKQQARVLPATAVKTDRDKSDFVINEFRRLGRKVTPGAVRGLVEAVGRDLRELASACAQVAEDTTGVVDEDVVATYHGGRVEATGFRVADAAVAGDTAEALRLLRHALAGGLDPVPIVAVLAAQLRQMVRVGGAGRAPAGQLASSLGMPPWQVDKARRTLSGWSMDRLGTAIQAVAAADFQVKGGGRDPRYAVERAVLAVCRARRES